MLIGKLFSILLLSFLVYSQPFHRAIIKTCSGWRLNSLPLVKSFLFFQAESYPVEVVYCGGDPRLALMDDKGNELEEIDISEMNEEQIGNLIESKGFIPFHKLNITLNDE